MSPDLLTNVNGDVRSSKTILSRFQSYLSYPKSPQRLSSLVWLLHPDSSSKKLNLNPEDKLES